MRALTASRLVGVLALAALWLTVWCAPAVAHARLLQETPASGASLEEPPEQVWLRFNEPVDAEFDPLKVYDAEGDRVDEDDASTDPDDARILLAGLEDLPVGSYRVEWRVTSIDGHVIEDAYAFNVTPGAGEAGGGSRAEEGEARPAAGEEPAAAGSSGGLDRSVLYSILTFGVLGLVVLALVAARWLRRRSGGVR